MKNFIDINQLSKSDFFSILKYSKDLSSNFEPVLKNKNIGLIFEKNSTRTRLSFQVGIKQLSGNYIDIRLDDLNINRFESLEDTFKMMSLYLDCIIFRTTSHSKLGIAKKYFKKPIINALSDLSHPCQSISDIFTLEEHFGSANNLNIIWMGDINNVLISLIETIEFLDNTKIIIFTDKNIHKKQENNILSKNISIHYELDEKVLYSADCIMTDVYNSMNDKNDKEKLLNKFQINKHIMNKTNKNTVFMHCLPAKIGSEVTKEVLDGKNSIVLQQAKNRMVTQRGILKWLDI